MPIVLRNVRAGYDGRWILKGVSVNIDGNTIILGPNGSGKTTLFRVILGLSVKKSGEVVIDNYEVDHLTRTPGLVATNLPEIVLRFTVSMRDIAKLYLDLMNGDFDYFTNLLNKLNISNALSKKFTHLSQGSRILVLNSLALASRAKYVLLDEPFENVDPARRSIILGEILTCKSNIIMNTHTTWLLNHVGDWKAYLLTFGQSYGPLAVNELLSSKISKTKTENTILELSLEDKIIYLTRNSGTPLSSLDSLDRLFEVMI